MNFCPNCGTDLRASLDGVQVMCRMCGAPMVPAESDPTSPVFVCPRCGAYYGNFLNTGVMTYYTQEHLRVGRVIKAEIALMGRCRTMVKRMEMVEREGMIELARKIQADLGDMGVDDVFRALQYLEEEGVISLKCYDMDKDFVWVEVRFNEKGQGQMVRDV